MADLIITIDGPAASGKSTVARLLADRLNASFIDTGAMYRAVTLAAMRAGVDLNDEQNLLDVMQKHEFQFSDRAGKMIVRIDGSDVTEDIRSPDVTANARYIAAAPKVRERLVQMQRQFAAGRQKIVTEGRDQGTVAFSDADIKFFLTADLAERARRRQAELDARDSSPSQGVPKGEPTRDKKDIRKAIEQRDKSDESRAVGPLKPAEDAIIVDTTNLNIEQVVQKLTSYVKEKCSKKT
jgi:cytidylate kinase